MHHGVCAQVSPLTKAASAHVTRVRPVAAVRAHVVVQVEAAQEHLAALVAAVHTAPLVHLARTGGHGVSLSAGEGHHKEKTSKLLRRRTAFHIAMYQDISITSIPTHSDITNIVPLLGVVSNSKWVAEIQQSRKFLPPPLRLWLTNQPSYCVRCPATPHLFDMLPQVVLLTEGLDTEVALVGGALGRVGGLVLPEPRWPLERLTAVAAHQTAVLGTHG